MTKIEETKRNILRGMYRFAKELCETEIPQIYEFGHYLIDNLISKICMIVGEEEGIEFESKTKSGKIKTYDFHNLYKKILLSKYNNAPDYSKVEKLHEQRNNYQHGRLSIDHIFHQQYALEYLEKAEEIMKIIGIFGIDDEIPATNYFIKDLQNHYKNENFKENKELRIKCLDSLQNICSDLYGIDIGHFDRDSPRLISSLNFLKTFKDLIIPLGITYLEESIERSKAAFISLSKEEEGVQIFIHVNCGKSLEIILDRWQFEVGKIHKFNINGIEVQSFKDISQILECLHEKIFKNVSYESDIR